MKDTKGLIPLIILFFSLAYLPLEGQVGIEVGARAGIAHYYGDLNPSYKLSDPGPTFGVKVRRNFNERLCIALGLDYSKVSGSDNDSYNSFELNRNLDFNSNVLDANFTFEFNFFPYIHGTQDNYYTPYLFGGFSIMKFNPKTEYQGTSYVLRDLQTEGIDYSLVSGSWVYGFGFKWDINRDFSVNIELSGRSIFSDYIDDVKGDFTNNTLSNRSEDIDFGEPETQRGDGRNADSVYFFSIGIMRYYGRIHCPPITKDFY